MPLGTGASFTALAGKPNCCLNASNTLVLLDVILGSFE